MEPLPQGFDPEDKVSADIRSTLALIREASAGPDPDSTAAGIDLLRRLRQQVYENLNQIQHEYLILQAAACIRREHLVEVEGHQWFWNPRQTGKGTEPDLSVFLGTEQVISTEVTASEDPQGAIDKRMAQTLEKLSQMAGHKFYFVRTQRMRQRAITKVGKAGWQIDVVLL
jgi:hypothetical protein